MAYTQTDLDNLKRAYASGVTTVEFNGRRTTFRSLDELERVMTAVETEVAPTTTTRGKTKLARLYTRKGF
jgi:hypothetical protein